MCSSHDEVVKRFAARRVNKRTNVVSWASGNVYCEDDTIYSYGSHFPMAKYLGQVKDRHVFIKNGDRYSSSTACHQGMVQSACYGPTVSVSALRSAGINFHGLTLANIVDFQPDLREHVYQDKDGHFWKHVEFVGKTAKPVFSEPFKKPRQGMFIPYGSQDEDRWKYRSGVWHVLGAVVLGISEKETSEDRWSNKHGEDADGCYLASLDESQYFIAKLPSPVKTVQEAFKSLQPPEVQRALRRKVDVKRQGEWFFVPTGLKTPDLREKVGLTQKAFDRIAKIVPLPERPTVTGTDQERRQRNKHICRQYFIVDDGLYCTGVVRHRGPDNHATGEHRPLNLGDQWYKAYLNTELASWTVGGKFD
jgi:hypothetical protein